MSFQRDRGERGPSEPPLPKPYEFVPLAPGHVPKGQPAGHQRFQQLGFGDGSGHRPGGVSGWGW